MALENHEIVLDGDAPRIDLELCSNSSTDNGWSSRKIPVERDEHRAWPRRIVPESGTATRGTQLASQ